MNEADKVALARVRDGWLKVKGEVEAARKELQTQIAELDNPATWECREAVRVRGKVHTASLGLRNRINEADQMIAVIDVSMRPTPS